MPTDLTQYIAQWPKGPPETWPNGDRGPVIIAVQILMIILASTAVSARFIARRMSAAGAYPRIWWDDWVILAALMCSVGINIINLIAVPLGLGKHIWHVDDLGRAYLKSLFGTEVLYTLSLALNKIGVLLMYQKLFCIDRAFTVALRLVAAVVVGWFIGIEIATLLQCVPVNKFWDYLIEGECFDIVKFFEGSAIPNVIIDLAILMLPQPILWKLNLSKTNKLALCGIFLLGAFTAVSSIGRLAAIVEYHGGLDFTYDAFVPIMWYSLEPAIGITCACLPCLGPILRKLPGSPFGSLHSNPSSRYPSLHTSGHFSSIPKGARRLSLDTESVTNLTKSSFHTSVYALASNSFEDLHGANGNSHEMGVIHVRSSTHVTSPISPISS